MKSQIRLVAPFIAERFRRVEKLTTLIAPPYDVIGDERRATLAGSSEHNIVHLILPAGNGDRYEHAAGLLSAWRSEGVLERDAVPTATVVRQHFRTPDGAEYARTGVVAGVHVEPYEAGRVLPHERTHRGPKEDRLALSRATVAMLESIFLLSRDADGALRAGLARATRSEPTALADLDGVRIELWRVEGETAETLAAAAGSALYIADGHHRFETANAYRAINPAADRIPALIVPIDDPGMVVLPTHRLIHGSPISAERARRIVQKTRVVRDVPAAQAALAIHSLPRACAVLLADGSAFVAEGDAVPRGSGEVEPGIGAVERDVVQPLLQEAGEGAKLAH